MEEENPTDKETSEESMAWTARVKKMARHGKRAGVENEEDRRRAASLKTDPDDVVWRDSLVKDPKARSVKKGHKKARRCVFFRTYFPEFSDYSATIDCKEDTHFS